MHKSLLSVIAILLVFSSCFKEEEPMPPACSQQQGNNDDEGEAPRTGRERAEQSHQRKLVRLIGHETSRQKGQTQNLGVGIECRFDDQERAPVPGAIAPAGPLRAAPETTAKRRDVRLLLPINAFSWGCLRRNSGHSCRDREWLPRLEEDGGPTA